MNGEHYPDPTADRACAHIEREQREVARLVRVLKEICEIGGYKVIGRIGLKNINSGNKYL